MSNILDKKYVANYFFLNSFNKNKKPSKASISTYLVTNLDHPNVSLFSHHNASCLSSTTAWAWVRIGRNCCSASHEDSQPYHRIQTSNNSLGTKRASQSNYVLQKWQVAVWHCSRRSVVCVAPGCYNLGFGRQGELRLVPLNFSIITSANLMHSLLKTASNVENVHPQHPRFATRMQRVLAGSAVAFQDKRCEGPFAPHDRHPSI